MVFRKFECKYLFSVTSGKNDNNVFKKKLLAIKCINNNKLFYNYRSEYTDVKLAA